MKNTIKILIVLVTFFALTWMNEKLVRPVFAQTVPTIEVINTHNSVIVTKLTDGKNVCYITQYSGVAISCKFN